MITKISDHEARMQSLLITQFRNKTNIAGIIKAFAIEVQEIEDAAYNLFRSFDLEDAVGHQLDLLGKLVGEERQGRSDTIFRSALKSRVGINVAHGEPEKIIEILISLTNSTIVQIIDIYPAGMYIFFNGTPADFADIYNQIKLVTAGGVSLTLATNNEFIPFVFDGDDDGLGFTTSGFSTDGSFVGIV